MGDRPPVPAAAALCGGSACRRPLTVYFVSSQLCWQAQSSSSTAPSLNKNCKLRVKRSGAASILILSSAEQQLDQDQLIQSEISVGQQFRPVLYRNLSSPELHSTGCGLLCR